MQRRSIGNAQRLASLPPTKAEQEAIAEALSDADALIESLEQLIAKKRHLKQGAMQELLTGKRRLPGFSGEWEVKRLARLRTRSWIPRSDTHGDFAFTTFARRHTIEERWRLFERFSHSVALRSLFESS